MKAIFVTGTDTGVGKTVITGCLFRYLTEKGYNVITQKWVQTGADSIYSSDIKIHFKIAKQDLSQKKKIFSLILPNIFKTPASPLLAGRLEKRKVSVEKIKKNFRSLSKKFDFVIVEGIGGALVPINQERLVIDAVCELKLPVLIVAGNKLGGINHSLLTIEALNLRKIEIVGLIFNNLARQNNIILKDNPQIVKSLTSQNIFGILPQEKNYEKLYKQFIPIGNKMIKRLNLNG